MTKIENLLVGEENLILELPENKSPHQRGTLNLIVQCTVTENDQKRLVCSVGLLTNNIEVPELHANKVLFAQLL